MSHDPNYVKWVQRSLNRLMVKNLTINGIRDGNAEYTGAIAEFKAVYTIEEPGLTGDQIGAECQDAIIRFNNNGGDYGDYCTWLCKVVPNAPAQAEGVSGQLEAAVRKFQQNEKLNVDGWVGYKTELRLIQTSKTEPPGSKRGDTPKGGGRPKPSIPARLNGVTDYLDPWVKKDPSREMLVKSITGTIASEILGKMKGVKGGVASALVEPLTWYLDGETPDASDALLYGLGLIPPLSLAVLAISTYRAYLEDGTLDKVAEIEHDEPRHLTGTIFPTATYYWGEQDYNAAVRIASKGGVAWQHPNGLWVFSKLEKKGKTILTCDTKPRKAIKIIRPELPLQWNGYGFVWRTYNYR